MQKRILALVLILTMVMIPLTSFAEEGPKVTVDSKPIEFTVDSGIPFIDVNDRSLVPLRLTMETYGAEVEWHADTSTAILKKDGIVVEVPVGEKYILRNGEKVSIDTESVNKDDRIYLPIRAVVESFGSQIQWDQATQTVNIVSESIDAKKAILDAYAKNYEWKSYDMEMTMNMSMPISDVDGSIDMAMNMDMTVFMDPIKIKSTANMAMDMGNMQLDQPLMEMYITMEEDTMSTYVGTYEEDGTISWVKTVDGNELYSELMNIEANEELNAASIKDARFLGLETINNKSLQKFEITTSFDTYNEMMGGYMDMLSASESAEDLMALDMLMNLDDIVFLVYIDESTGEIARYEMDLSELIASMIKSMSEELEIPEDELGMLESMEMTIVMDILNINASKDFEIPQEALDAELIAE